jgi:hypothetical protein
MMTDDEILYGVPGATDRGLLSKPTTRHLPPSTMTRQRRRAAERAASRGTPGLESLRPRAADTDTARHTRREQILRGEGFGRSVPEG